MMCGVGQGTGAKLCNESLLLKWNDESRLKVSRKKSLR